MTHDSRPTYWRNAVHERLQSLPSDSAALLSELREASHAYNVLCAELNKRVESLALQQERLPRRTTSTLPAEILLIVFKFLSQDEPLGDLRGCNGRIDEMDAESDDGSWPDGESDDGEDCSLYICHDENGDCCLVSALGWSRVSHVCSQWRSIAIGNASLWTTLPLNLCTPWTSELVLRSKGHLLDITVPCDANWDGVTDVFTNNLHHVRSIDVERGADVVHAFLSNHSAPKLENLYIDHSAGNDNAMFPLDDIAHSFPRLRQLSLASTAFLPNLCGLATSQITHLALLSVANAPSAQQFRDMLRSLVGVHYLHLEHCFPLQFKGKQQAPIVLSHLETLILRGSRKSCGVLIRSIHYPPFASTTLYLERGKEVFVTDTHEYLQHSGLNVLFDNIASTVLHSLHVSCIQPRPHTWQLIVAGRRDHCDIREYIHEDHTREWTGPSFQDLKITCLLNEREPSPVIALFTLIMEHLLLPSLSMLSLNVDGLLCLDTKPWNETRWLSVLKEGKEVEHLQLISLPWRALDGKEPAQPSPYVNLLMALALSKSAGCRPHFIFPNLEALDLINVDAAATMLLKGRRYEKDMQISATQALRFFWRMRWSYFDENNIRVGYQDAAWQSRYITPTVTYDSSPLQEMFSGAVRERELDAEFVQIRMRAIPL